MRGEVGEDRDQFGRVAAPRVVGADVGYSIIPSGATTYRAGMVNVQLGGAIALVAEGEVELVIGSAAKHPYPLVSGSYSIHTSLGALARGEHTIAELAHSPAVIALHRR